jgi:selenocysteine lyase/cysteine desulfurase
MPAPATTPPETGPAGRPPLLAPLAFLAAYPGYRDTAVLDQLRATEYWYLDAGGHTYLDYTGAGLPAQAQLSGHADRLHGRCFGNPHSDNPTSAASTRLISAARQLVLEHFCAPPDEYEVIFTPNASGACRLVGEAYPFGPSAPLVLTCDNHNSVNGIREFARARGAAIEYVPFSSAELRVADDGIHAALRGHRPPAARATAGRGLFAYPAQSNFSGVQHPLRWIDAAHQNGYDVLLDAAAYVPANRLDLSAVKPDFVPVSWYKVFGYPTGVGCLIARREALARLRRPWFAGGTIHAASVRDDWHAMADDEARFEDGTPSFLQVPDLECGLSWINGIGIEVIRQRAGYLTGWMLGRLGALRHGNGEPMARIHGPADTRARGGTVAFNLLDPGGDIIDSRAVERAAAGAGISVRTGCFCNPGAAEGAFDLIRPRATTAPQPAARTLAEHREALGLWRGGAIRASVGVASDIGDVERFLSLAETYRDRRADQCPRPRQPD